MPTSTKPVVSSVSPNARIVDPKSGLLTWIGLKWFQNIQKTINAAFDQQSALQGIIGTSAAISGNSATLSAQVQHLSGGGGISPAGLPAPTGATLGGVKSAGPTANMFVNQIDATGTPGLAQPSFANLSGTLGAGQLPNPTLVALGGVEANNPVASNWVNAINTIGVPQLSQPAFTDISGTATAGQIPALSALSGNITASQGPAAAFSGTITTAKLTGGGANGSMTFQNGILTSQVAAT